jgi:hypothetical protein
MLTTLLPSASETALLTVHLIMRYDDEKGKKTTRARISAKTLRILSSRAHLRESFCEDWIDELGVLGWTAFPIGDHFALILSQTIADWPRLGATRIRDTLHRVRQNDQSVFEGILDAIVDEKDYEIRSANIGVDE